MVTAAVYMRFSAGSSRCPFSILSNPHNESNLQAMPLIKVRFCPKNEAVLQKIGGPTGIILHFFSRFSYFSWFVPLQAVVSELLAPAQPLQ
jgi:hypothetical protein